MELDSISGRIAQQLHPNERIQIKGFEQTNFNNTMAVIDAQAGGCSDEELAKLQAELNSVYDKFRKAYGNITDSANERCFRADDDYNTLAALEIVDSEKKTVEKAEFFSKRTIQPEVVITNVETPQEALQVSIDRIGGVDIEYMARLVGSTPEQVIKDLGTDIFRNPAKIKDDDTLSGYEDASEYLSGNVRKKLKIAQDYATHIDSIFARNVDALKAVIPKDLEAGEISVRIGANWIYVEDYNKFLKEYAKADTSSWGGHPVVRTKKYINQIMTSKDPVRVSEDVDEMVLTYSQMQAIASGNPMIKEKIQLDNDIAMLKTLEAEQKNPCSKCRSWRSADCRRRLTITRICFKRRVPI